MMEAELELFELNNEDRKTRVIMAGRRLRQYLFQVSLIIFLHLFKFYQVPRSCVSLFSCLWC